MEGWAKGKLGKKKKERKKTCARSRFDVAKFMRSIWTLLLLRDLALPHSRHVGEEAVLVVDAPFTIGAGPLACRLIR